VLCADLATSQILFSRSRRAQNVLYDGKDLRPLSRGELLYQAEQSLERLIRVDVITTSTAGPDTRRQPCPFSQSVEVEPVEVSQLKEHEGVRPLDQTSFDLRQVGVGAAGYPLDLTQRQSAVLTCVPQNTSDGRWLVPDLIDSHRKAIPGDPATAAGTGFRRCRLRMCPRACHRLTVERLGPLWNADGTRDLCWTLHGCIVLRRGAKENELWT
jgi:hypothetical protein